MCEFCGCITHVNENGEGTGPVRVVDVNRSLLEANEAQARVNRGHMEAMGAVALNLISAPGSGKTMLLEKTIDLLGDDFRIGVIEGDIETERDAARIRAKGVPAVQLTTGGACHLDAPLVHRGIHDLEGQLNGKGLDLLFIENVGNLVCPATFDLGEHERIVLVSVPEGPDKPAKYPKAFVSSQVFLISKTDLLPYFDFFVEEARAEALRLNPALNVIPLSAVSGDGMEQWAAYLRSLIARYAVKADKNG
jgi:hydrogenase nickel incorporation protein HypB